MENIFHVRACPYRQGQCRVGIRRRLENFTSLLQTATASPHHHALPNSTKTLWQRNYEFTVPHNAIDLRVKEMFHLISELY